MIFTLYSSENNCKITATQGKEVREIAIKYINVPQKQFFSFFLFSRLFASKKENNIFLNRHAEDATTALEPGRPLEAGGAGGAGG